MHRARFGQRKAGREAERFRGVIHRHQAVGILLLGEDDEGWRSSPSPCKG